MMKKKISVKFRNRFGLIWISLLMVILAVSAARLLLVPKSAPTLEEVLSQKHTRQVKHISDFSWLVASLVGFSMAALSLAKGYELVSCKRPGREVSPARTEWIDLGADLEKRKRENARLVEANEHLQERVGEIETQLKIAACEIDELKRIEQMLRKSNIALGKDCERLKAENEELMLRVNAVQIRAESAPAPAVKKSEVKVLTKQKRSGAKTRRRKTKK